MTASHWGVYRAEVRAGEIEGFTSFEPDPSPSSIQDGYLDTLDDELRIRAPMVRKSWLEQGFGASPELRGREPFVEVSWDVAEQLVADELRRVRSEYGNAAIYGGSYGWSSAGRFHHAQSQLHRFLNCIGGYTKSKNSYSLAAGEVILKHIVGDPTTFIHGAPTWQSIIDHGELVVAFGGLPVRNAQVSTGGTGHHRAQEALSAAKVAGIRFINISPIRNDVSHEFDARWLAARPGSDVAIMAAVAHQILRQGRENREFLQKYTVGFEALEGYILGRSDSVPKTPEWAAEVSDIPAEQIRDLATRMAASRTVISVSWSLTRQYNGEQAFWMATALAAMLGQIGQPGGGVAYGYCAANSVGNERLNLRYASLPQGQNAVSSFIPVSRISDMLLNPGTPFHYDGEEHQFPHIKLVYWAGGNPFHHHQDLTRLSAAWQRPETIIHQDWCWNATARRADILLPCTTTLEREDIMMSPRDRFIVKMDRVVAPVGQARSDYDIFSGISRKLGTEDSFTEGRTEADWLEWIYTESRKRAAESGVNLLPYADFLKATWQETPLPEDGRDAFTDFIANPQSKPLDTPSGKIEIASPDIAKSPHGAMLPHPAWYPPKEWLGTAGPEEFHLISGQPADKLHSQLDHGKVSRARKLKGRSKLGIHPDDASSAGIKECDTVRVFNKRGAFLATAVLNDGLRRRVLELSTGAWFDPVAQADGTLMCRHGNPNAVTRDDGGSVLSQGPVAHSCLVRIEPVSDAAKPNPFAPPTIQPLTY